MHIWLKRRRLAPSARATISKGAQLALLFCSLGIVSVLLVAGGTIARPNATGSNPAEPSSGQTQKNAPAGMVWIPGEAFLSGPNGKAGFRICRRAPFRRV